jgi:ketosteroid isomerase-like protein
MLDRYPDVSFTLVSELEDADGRVAFEWAMRATFTAPDGRRLPVTLAGCDVCRVKDGKIVELRGYFDRAHVMEQLQGPAPS